jgi:hypothetical protein
MLASRADPEGFRKKPSESRPNEISCSYGNLKRLPAINILFKEYGSMKGADKVS